MYSTQSLTRALDSLKRRWLTLIAPRRIPGLGSCLWRRSYTYSPPLSSSGTRISLQEAAMPVYDYVCQDCHKTFELVLTVGEHDHETVKCPKCGSKHVEQEATAFFAVTSKKS